MIKRNIEAIYRLSPMQQGMVFHSLHAPRSGVYCEQLCCTLRGPLDVEAFRRAWEGVVDRHPALRTAFVWKRVEQMLQVVHRSVELPFTLVDCRDQSEEAQARELECFLVEDRANGFDLSQAPLIRLCLMQVADEAHYFVLSFHHAILDGWSFPIVLEEVSALYQAHRRGEVARLEEPTSYHSYIKWLEQQDPERAAAFWREKLSGVTTPTSLHIDGGPGSTGRLGDHKSVRTRLSAPTTRELHSLARRYGVTISTLVQAAWGLLLSRYAGEDDILFGATVAGRPAELPGVERAVGLFINTLPIRLRVPTGTALGEWLTQFQTELSECREYEYSSLVQIHGWSSMPRGRPLFDSIVVFENYPVDDRLQSLSPDLRVEGLRSIEQTNYSLTVVSAAEEELPLKVQYDAQRFGQTSMQRLLDHLCVALEGMPDHCDRPVVSLPLLTEDERERLLYDWNLTESEYPRERCAHELFGEQVARTPSAVAVEAGANQLTYAELNERANQLAHHLASLEFGREARVGICLPRSTDAIVAILATLKAGCAYVPLDPDYPEERLAYMLVDSQAAAVVTTDPLLKHLPPYSGEVVLLDADHAKIQQRPLDPPQIRVDPDQLAYVIYTSGSTGRPKGTLLQHRGLTNLATGIPDVFGIGQSSRVLLFASLNFDASVADIFGSLTRGATLHVPSKETVSSLPDLHRLLRERSINVFIMPPSILASLEAEGLDDVCTVVSAGERCPEGLVQRWAVGRRFVNGYGPTEATVGAAFYACSPEEKGAPPIGRPFTNTRLYVLDGHTRPVPLGVPGELYIGGTGLARGYLNRADLTAERFIPDPFSGQPGERLYRTGDLVRYRADGNLDFLGRVDHQVKVRGHRIELGEIEAMLSRQSGVREAVVVVRESTGAGKSLVAYLTRDGDERLDPSLLREALQLELPLYMVPSNFVELDRLPLTPSGKVDRAALPEPEYAGVVTRPYMPPRTAIESALAGIWASVLSVSRVGVHDDFHELGGHSLLATQLMSRIRETFQVELPISALFESPTIAGLAARIEETAWGGIGSELPPIEPISREGDLPLSYAQQRLWFLDQLVPGSPLYNIPSSVWLEGQLDAEVLRRSLEEIVCRHEVLRTTFRSEQGKPVQVIASEPAWSFEERDVRHLASGDRESEAIRQAREAARRPFDLESGPLLRVLLIKVDEDRHLLALTLHHIVADGWSLGVMVRELGLLYRAFSDSDGSPLPPLEIQYADFAAWQRDWFQGDVFERQMAYWKERLEGSLMLELPTDRPRPAVQSWRGATEQFSFSRDLQEKLQALGRREGVTLFMTLLAAFQVLLSRYAGQEDVSVGTAIANRRHGDTEDLIGFFVNTLVMRTDLSGDPTFRELLRRVREVALGAFAHQDVPFEMLVDELGPERDLSHTPLFQVAFALQNAPLEPLDLPGLHIAPFELDNATAKFDLSLNMAESKDGLLGSFEYSLDLFERETIRRMVGHLERVLEGVVADAGRRVSEVEYVGEEERGRLVVGWNETGVELALEGSAHERFERRVREDPEAEAVRFEGEVVSYGELDRRANQLARYLRGLGVGRGDLVCLSMDRGVEMVVGVVGTMKAGAAYVPVDPSYPPDRVAYMLEDSGAEVVLTQSHLAGELPVKGARVVEVDGDWEEISKESEASLEVGVGSEDVAYVIYTSGSTGRPKGTVLRHGGLVNLSEAQREAFGIGRGSRVLQFAPLSFDASVWEMFMALGNGGTLSVMRQEVLASVSELGEALGEEGVTAMTLPPSVLGVLESEGLEELRTVVAAGEACSLELVRRWSGEGREFFNAYGPTETTVCASMYRCEGDEEEAPPIGRPLRNMRLYVLDGNQRLVAEGLPGELCVGGVGVAQGYLRRPELTAEKFVPDPFSGEAGGRLYRTGDLVRYRRDGNLEFLGRIDHQVKLRGFRIELGEIEGLLTSHPKVRESVVLARSIAGDERLVAYVVPADAEEQPTVPELRRHLATQVPGYMAPSAFVTLDALPRTPAGKVDRRSLPAPDGTRGDTSTEYKAPSTDVEKQLAELFAELLGTERIGVHDDFFELGGHSLLATQLVSQVRERFHVEFPLRSFFEAPTVAGLAERIAAAEATDARSLARIADALGAMDELSEDEVKALLQKKRRSMEYKS